MPPRVPPSADDVTELTRLHREARYLDAYRFAQQFAEPETWTDTTAVILAGRLFSCWGDLHRSDRLHAKAWRAEPENPAAIYFYELTLEHKHGPFFALGFLRDQQLHIGDGFGTQHHVWLALSRARLLAYFRDFDAANALLAQTEPHGGKDAWWWVEQARIREQQDRYDDALASAEQALALRPNYRPAIETLAHLFMLLNRDADALALLRRAVTELQAANLGQMLAVLLAEMELHSEVIAALEKVEAWLPCADKRQRGWLAARRSDAWRALGRQTEAAEQARLVDYPFHDHIAERIAANASGKRVLLPVPFVRQHHLTCAPATLAALGRFWQQTIDHLELARIICYDGTPDHEERHWAETHGWVVREFRVTWEVTTALIDRGCPFTLTTVAIRSAHLQAVVGYDAAFDLLLIRDPYQRTHSEFVAQPFLQAAVSHGPRGMVLVPADRSGLLDGIELPDASQYDRWYALRRALMRHDRDAAQREADALMAAAPEHLLALKAQRELAFYDGDVLRQLEATQRLRGAFPDDSNFQLDELQQLRALGRVEELREAVAKTATRCEPQFLRERAEVLVADARTHDRAERLLARVLRRLPTDAGNLYAFANLLWSRREFAAATEVYRLAACAGEKTEFLWDSLFAASRHVGKTESVVELLRQRYARLGEQSGQPARTLFRALDALDRTPEGFTALEDANRRRPNDGDLLLFMAEARGRYGEREASQAALAAADGRSSRADWLRTAARLAGFRADHVAALEHWRELLQLNPADIDAHGAVARLLETTAGREAALKFLEDACNAHPSLLPLHKLLLEWLRSELPARALAKLEQLLAIDPGNAWALREKALTLRRDRKAEAALGCAEEAERIEPSSAFSAGVLGAVLLDLNRPAEARAAFERALRLNVGCGYMFALLEACGDFAARQAAIAFLQGEIARQGAPDGDAILRFRDIARRVLPLAELRPAIERLLETHPDHWAVWSALTSVLLDANEIEAALARATEATQRFPLVPRAWVDLAAAQSRAQRSDAEVQSLQRALAVSPGWGFAARELAAAHERALRLDDAEHVLRRALAADPLDPATHGHLGDLLRRRGQKEEAVKLLERAVMLEPSYDWAWRRLDDWADEDAERDRALRLAETVTQARPGDARAWIRLARLQFRDLESALVSLDRAAEREPLNSDIYDLRAQLLAHAKRYEEALAACRATVLGENLPHELLGRAAWVDYRRGRSAAAQAAMETVVAAHPDYVWGWTCLTEWRWEANNFAGTAEAAQKWSWLVPTASVPFGYWAAAMVQQGKRHDAKGLFWRALHVEPTYTYGAQQLLQLLAEDRELDEATRLMRHIETHLSPADAQRAAVRFHIMRRDKVAAGAALAALGRVPASMTYLLEDAATALTEAGWRDVAEKALGPLLNDEKTNAEIGRIWVQAKAPASPWRMLRKLDKTGAPEAIRRAAWCAALSELAKKKATWRLRWFIHRRREWLRADTNTWGNVGSALSTAGEWRQVEKWLADWRQRRETEAWALHNLVLALYHRRKASEATTVVQHALTLPPDRTRANLLVWSGLDAALRDDAAAAAEAVAETTGASLRTYMTMTRRLLEIVVDFQRAGGTRDALRVAKRQLQEWSKESVARTESGLIYQRTRVLRYLGVRGGSLVTRLQSYAPPLTRRFELGSRTNLFWIWAAIVVMGLLGRCAGG